MPDYGEILRFLADNPPELAAERALHASLLELMATCLRAEEREMERRERADRGGFDGPIATCGRVVRLP